MLFPRNDVVESLRVILSTSVLDLDRTLWTQIIDQFQKHPKLSVTDVYLAHKAKSTKNSPLYTFDKNEVTHVSWTPDVAGFPPGRMSLW
ncbi:MAG: hypothetical protein ACTII7_11285, partial [Galactobacter sp.]